MTASWPLVPLGEVLKHRKEFIRISDLDKYKRCRVQLHAKGIVLRDTVPGSEIKTKEQQVCRAREFLVAEIDAKVGGFGIVPDDLHGSIVSSHYFLFEINQEKLDRGFLDYYVRTPFFRDQVAARGSTNYAAIRPQHVLQYQIPLPPLPEQQRIVARIEELAAKIEEAKALRQGAQREANALILSARRSLIGETPKANWIPLRKLVSEIENGKSPQCETGPAEINEWGVLKVGAVSFGNFKESENKALPPGASFDARYEVRRGDFLMSRANTTELVGACAIINGTRPKLLLSDKTFRFHFRKDVDLVLQWFDHVLKSPALREQIARRASGTSPTMKNISKEKVLALLVPPHSLSEQCHLVAELEALQAQVDVLKKLQLETTTELDAMLPSILDRAFRGDL